MDVVLVGSGNVASHMGPRLLECGHRVTAVFSRTMEPASALAASLGCVAVNSIDRLPDRADVCMCMLADSALPELAQVIAGHFGSDTVFLHTAGSLPMSLWADAGASRYGVLYPMVSFSKGVPVDWGQVPLFVEASDPVTLQTVTGMAARISGNVTELDSEGRRTLHLAAVFANNFSNRMYAISQILLQEHGVPFQVMLPLIREAVAKLEKLDPLQAQTGPAARGDGKVIAGHLEMLGRYPQWQELYRLISTDINDTLK